MEIEGMAGARAGTTEVAVARVKEELDKSMAQIQRLESENDQLRRANKVVHLERNRTEKAYQHLVKQISHCPCCRERLNTDKACLPTAPIHPEIRKSPEPVPLTDPQHLHHHSILPPHDASSATCAATISAALDLTAQSASPVGNGCTFLIASLPDSIASDSNGSPFFTDASPIPSSRHTQPSSVSSFGDFSLNRRARHVSPTPNGLLNNSRHVKVGLLATTPGQAASQGSPLESQADPLRIPWDVVEEGMDEMSERDQLVKTSERRNSINFESPFSSRAPSDTSMQSVSEQGEEDEIAIEADSDAQASSIYSNSSSDQTDSDSEDSSDVDRATSGSGSLEARKLPGFGYADNAIINAPESQNASSTCYTEGPFEQDLPTTHPRNGSARRRADKPQCFSKAHTATISSEALKVRSASANKTSAASKSLESRATYSPTTSGTPTSTLLGSSTRIRANQASPAVNTTASDGQRSEQLARYGEEESDVDLKTAIRESYAKFALNGQRLRFCYEPQTLDPTSINLNTNWKRRSKLNESIVEKLLQMGSEISAFLPESDSERATKKEIDLVRRLCRFNQSQTACGSLREVVGALRREREVTKDELNLIDFEIYSTLIVMKSQSEREASHLFPNFGDTVQLNRYSSRKRSQLLVGTSAPFSECTTAYIRFLQI